MTLCVASGQHCFDSSFQRGSGASSDLHYFKVAKEIMALLVLLSTILFYNHNYFFMKRSPVCMILSEIAFLLWFRTPLTHFMDGVRNDPQCIRGCALCYFVLSAVYNGPGQHLTGMEAHQGRPIRTSGSTLVNYCKVPSSTQWAFYEVHQLSKQINRTFMVPQHNHEAQGNHSSRRVIVAVSTRK